MTCCACRTALRQQQQQFVRHFAGPATAAASTSQCLYIIYLDTCITYVFYSTNNIHTCELGLLFGFAGLILASWGNDMSV